MAKRTNNKNYRSMLHMNEKKYEDAYNLFCKHSGLDIELSDMLEVIDLAYEKGESEKQLNTVLAFFEIESNYKNEFAIKSMIKYYGLANWCESKITTDND